MRIPSQFRENPLETKMRLFLGQVGNCFPLPIGEFFRENRNTFQNALSFNVLGVFKLFKEGGQEGYHSNRFDFLHHRRYFVGTLKGLTF